MKGITDNSKMKLKSFSEKMTCKLLKNYNRNIKWVVFLQLNTNYFDIGILARKHLLK